MAELQLQLARRVAEHANFKASYETLQKESLASLWGRSASLPRAESRKLLRSALIFAQSGDERFAVLSQDIIYSLASLPLFDEERVVCQHVLAMLGNFPASDFVKRDFESQYRLPWQLGLTEEVRRDGNLIQVLGAPVLLTDFQADVWEELIERQFLSIAAPTSAGKSFLIQTYLKSLIGEGERLLDVAYIVPSRSLIHEVQASLSAAFAAFPNAPIISSVPRADDRLAVNRSRIFVFTQERLRTAMDEAALTLDVLIVDEAQQISDGSRGMLLLSCLEDMHRRAPAAKILFITPGSRSGGPIGSLLGLGDLPTVETALRPVRQNLIYVDFITEKKQKLLNLSLHRDAESPLSLGMIELEKKGGTTEQQRFLSATVTLGGDGQNLVYASGKASAEKLAVGIVRLTQQKRQGSVSLKELSDFIRRHVHPEYALANCVEEGVAFHYGNMPTNITKAIEDCFSAGEIKYLVCTSTLLQGVNLPARNIFIHNPRKGKGNPMGPDDFWNLAGRAGRLAKDTHGNVFLVDYAKWDRKPIEEPRQREVVPSLTKAFTTAHSVVIEYVEDRNHRSGVKDTNFAESVFTRLFVDAQEGVLDRTVERATRGDFGVEAEKLKAAVSQYIGKVSLPAEIIKRNASVSPLRQQAMFDVLLEGVKQRRLKDYVPLHPLQPHADAKERLEFVMSLIHEHLEGKPSQAGRYFSWFSLSWMRGNSLKDMIDFQLRDAREKASASGGEPPVAGKIIIKVLSEVEEKLRFHYVRYFGCYIDLLKYAVKTISPDREFDVPPIPLFLELGACSGTMIGCMELGLSRIAAREVMDFLGAQDLDAVAVKKRLRNSKLATSGLSHIVLAELNRIGLSAV
ncbi:TPA: DEAD/DEAH box helicase [Burkholderia vietnamiensis]|uniref:DEAD/DEAH box helicase n=1 Tax=Burkholderia vietnamiensis TaxID=60552 RepID=UPI001593825D|nr:DEAD/DEAH box helicase [Burkholderia vietnamiensis]HDR9008253.1 DEAD/DEAH box helicase [Burkholderia vietnamiensis]HDR9017567.1 DEAD/DEAH box helicase [Burkholderia vietnamiensis]